MSQIKERLHFATFSKLYRMIKEKTNTKYDIYQDISFRN